MIHRQLGYAARRAVRSILSAPVLQLVAVSTIALSLLVFCVVVTLAVNLDRVAAQWGDEMGVVAFLGPEHAPHILTDAKAVVSDWPEVGAVRVYTRAEALADLRKALGTDGALLEGVDPRVVPASIEVILADGHQSRAACAVLAEKLRALPGLGEVGQLDTGEDLLGRLSEVRDLLQLGGLVVGLLVLLAVTFIISNTIL